MSEKAKKGPSEYFPDKRTRERSKVLRETSYKRDTLKKERRLIRKQKHEIEYYFTMDVQVALEDTGEFHPSQEDKQKFSNFKYEAFRKSGISTMLDNPHITLTLVENNPALQRKLFQLILEKGKESYKTIGNLYNFLKIHNRREAEVLRKTKIIDPILQSFSIGSDTLSAYSVGEKLSILKQFAPEQLSIAKTMIRKKLKHNKEFNEAILNRYKIDKRAFQDNIDANENKRKQLEALFDRY